MMKSTQLEYKTMQLYSKAITSKNGINEILKLSIKNFHGVILLR